MPPRKRANPSSSSSAAARKHNQNQASQPSKYGIQHFFERHSQHAVSASQDPRLDLGESDRRKSFSSKGRGRKSLRDLDANAANSNLLGVGDAPGSRVLSSDIAPVEPGFEKANENRMVEASERLETGIVSNCASQSTPLDNLLRSRNHGEDAVSPFEVSPEMMKSLSVKRFKFSPGMLIKQSQDDGGDEVTWKISPVNERLQTVSKHMPETIKVLAESSRLNSSYIRQCSQIMSREAAGSSGMCLSSPSKKASGRSCCANSLGVKGVNLDKNTDHEGKSSEVITTQVASQQSPFQTPPSLSYCQDKPANSTACNGVLNELGLREHKKALLELLDQVEDAISINEPLPNVLKGCSSEVRNGKFCEIPVKVCCNARAVVEQKANKASLDDIFLVLEVAENSGSADSSYGQSPYKVLRLLNEQNGEERTIHLWDEWFYSVISPGDTVNVIGQFDVQGKCDVSRDRNFLIVHPDLLMSGTRVAASFTCPRRTVLDERLKSSEYSTAALIGTLLHQIFQAGLVKEEPTREFLDQYAGVVLQKNVESLYACGVSEKDILNTLIEANPRLLNWIILFKNSQFQKAPTVDFGSEDGFKKVNISEVIDIEEMSWAPKYGLKGMIDASVRVTVESNTTGVVEKIVPLEFKSGKGPNGQSSMEHCAQVILYTLLMSERYLKPIDSGLLYYLQSDHTQGITVRRSDLVGLIMRRNELATYILKALTTQQLPPMLQSPSICKGCRHIDVCTLYHKAHGGSTENSGLGDLFDANTNHLMPVHSDFLRHWDRLIDLEAGEAEHRKKELWRSLNSRRDDSACSLSSLVLDTSDKMTSCMPSRDNRFIYRFMGQNLTSEQAERLVGNTLSAGDSTTGFACKLSRGDIVILSTESGQRAIASGVISDISRFHVSVSFSKPLRLPGYSPLSEVQDLVNEVWRIDKDEITTSFAVMRFNLVQLFWQDARSSHLRKMIVDLEPPRFDGGCIFSQDPAISYVWSEEKLNDDQRRAIVKILTAKDYTLILGMPGTGKTSTMVHAVKALLMRGASILLTSYTNSAVDNLLIKLKEQGIDFVRIGRPEVVHEEVREHCFPEKGMQSVDGIKLRLDQVKVVAVTCLGITSPLLASKRFDVCIMDEAGQTTLPVSLGPLMFASAFVLVGDHYQLPPLVQSTEARENGLGISLFRRLSEAHPQAISALQSQYRMCQGVMQLSNALIYGDRLRCGSSDVANAKLNFAKEKLYSSQLKEVLEPGTPVVFLNTDLLPAFEEKDRKTLKNPIEACIIGKITEELVESGIEEEDIGIITPYNSQAELIRNAVCRPSVEIHTIDKYQGRDKDCIIVSFVRSNKEGNHCNSSLLGDWHRINVALTRAKKKLIMVGSLSTLSKLPLLKLLIENVDQQSGILSLSKEGFSSMECLKRCSHAERN